MSELVSESKFPASTKYTVSGRKWDQLSADRAGRYSLLHDPAIDH
jgi:hypothetical protein